MKNGTPLSREALATFKRGEFPPRSVDRLGDEPNLLLAAHLALALLGARTGARLEEVIDGFRAHHPELRAYGYLNLSVLDVEALRASYPFIPRWESSTKSEGDLHLAKGGRFDSPELDKLIADLRTLGDIPFECETLVSYHQTRNERGLLNDAILVSTDHGLGDKYAFYRDAVVRGGIHGDDLHLILKGSTSDGVVADLLARSLGARVRVASSREELQALTRQALKEAYDAGPSTLVTHLQGVEPWDELDALALAHPETRSLAISHTKSDSRGLLATRGEIHGVSAVLMSTSVGKTAHEFNLLGDRFDALILRLGREFNLPLWNAHCVVSGGGDVGVPAYFAANPLSVRSAVIVDVDENQRERLDGFQLPNQDDLASALGDSTHTLALSCVGKRVWGEEELRALRGHAVLLNFGTDDKDVDVAALRRLATDSEGREHSTVLGKLGDLSVTRFILQQGEGRGTEVVLVGGGYVSSFTETNPSAPAQSQVNNLLILESIHQAHFHAERDERGVYDLESITVSELESGHIAVNLHPRSGTLEEATLMRPDVRLESTQPVEIFVDGAPTSAADKATHREDAPVRSARPERSALWQPEDSREESPARRHRAFLASALDALHADAKPGAPAEPDFVLAAHLAQALIGAPVGATYETVLSDFSTTPG
ncbi:MAG: hypothetical protein AAF658_10340, partial [Myxococcota bacterium]